MWSFIDPDRDLALAAAVIGRVPGRHFRDPAQHPDERFHCG